jgi:hypothetical protein
MKTALFLLSGLLALSPFAAGDSLAQQPAKTRAEGRLRAGAAYRRIQDRRRARAEEEGLQDPLCRVLDRPRSQWAQDIVAGYKSPTFKTAIQADRFYDGFTLPDYMK